MIDSGDDRDIGSVSKCHMELGQKTRLRRVIIGHDLVILLFSDEFKNRKLLAFTQDRFTLARVW